MTAMGTMEYVRLDSSNAEYPVRLRGILDGEPVFAIGNLGLAQGSAVGICGSRDASPGALRWSYEFGRQVAYKGLVVVSGYAKGVDRQAHKGALEAGGSTIAVLPEGIRRFRVRKDLGSLVRLDRNFLAISQFDPDASWQTWRAMARNKVIVGLSNSLFVIEARERGGTIDAAKESALQGKPVYVLDYGNELPGREGNRLLLTLSGIPVRNADDLRKAIEASRSEPPKVAEQLVMRLREQADG